jgi:Ser/Thr protein kinase RdoA (MazF antagonist)
MGAASDPQAIERLAREALDAYDVRPTVSSLVSDEWNHTFRVETADGRAYALRVYRAGRRTDEEIRMEIGWLESLASAGFSVLRPVRPLDGSAFVTAGTGEDRRRVAVFGWVPGRALGDDPDPTCVAALGETIARLHEHGRAFGARAGVRTWDSAFPNGERSLFHPANHHLLDETAEDTFRLAFAAAEGAIARLHGAAEAPHIVHGDLHQDNVLVDGEDVWVIDFDDCMVAWPVQDLGVTMWEMGEDGATWPLRETLRDGYERVGPWPERHAGEIDVFAANRGLLKADDVVRDPLGRTDDELRASLRRQAKAIAWFLGRAFAG